VRDVVPDLGTIYDEPFADSSQVPTFLIAKLARTEVTVALTGDGGDELFGGYRRYIRGPLIWRTNRAVPRFIRQGAAKVTAALAGGPETRLAKNVIDMEAGKVMDMYRNRISASRKPAALLQQGSETIPGFMEAAAGVAIPETAHHMMFLDMVNYLTDDILVKVDRASMAVSLELRNPILDHRVIEFAWRLPLAMKIENRQGKLILKKVLARHLPKELIERPKMGFGAPTSSWLAGPLKGWSEELLSEKRLVEEGFFQPEVVRGLWIDFLAKKQKYHHILWNVLMFQAWHERRQRSC
jgi:asparagine synthase (glutamine-hydrolysing)